VIGEGGAGAFGECGPIAAFGKGYATLVGHFNEEEVGLKFPPF